ncbi:GGDEF domain-containing protein [Paenibacillus protaetiae]|uniref:GGDEF domain-containing protein n=1 Tax=Paenibacillus protaetiae TaxID=2509456 RepID=A0A4P6ETP1_9BACL|nr:GGDEF domain-containing protein [Paenibacillus protaetiae]QAY66560.1 GGDEF domain-containing protein [Paenibacillus protaetiae]
MSNFGLLNQKLIREVQARWRQGRCVGVLFVQLRGNYARGWTILRRWSRQHPQLFWCHHLDDCGYFFLACGTKEPEKQLEQVLSSAKMFYKQAAESDWNGPGESKPDDQSGSPFDSAFSSGVIAIRHPKRDESAETAVFKGIREAEAKVWRNAETAASSEPGLAFRKPPLDPDSPFGIGRLAAAYPIFQANQKVHELAGFFQAHNAEQGAIIVSGMRPVGLLMKEKLHQLLSGLYGLPLYSNREISRVMDASPLIVDAELPVEQAAQLAMARDDAKMYDIVIITQGAGGPLLGAASIRSILECITALRTEAARTANPLTGLPGNWSIQSQLQKKLGSGEPFSIVYADIDYFKWYNDCYGFARGDEVIRYMAELLQSAVTDYGMPGDFIGHVGGDDFIAVLSTAEAESFCESLIREFDNGIPFFYEDAEAQAVTDREGRPAGQSGLSISLALLKCGGRGQITMEQVSRLSADLKKKAKAIQGSAVIAGDIRQGT